ncbi:Glycoside hydrolase [Candidatus Hydrogenisulfobacillus filiaventi]|uniref:Glycoside hydrolase n=1 Tax=Candidatus Hydrogenisulfobacillus filiaventi TaxID=2707344 RepID=A0A6F8ZFP5_9FIRM|nr:Glycoside hydrolase [Candidatus Hydrogenisulfobacillus filiaventi]
MRTLPGRRLLAAAAAGLLLGTAGCGRPAAGGPQGGGAIRSAGRGGAPTRLRSGLKVIAFYDQSAANKTPESFSLLKAHPGLVTYLSPFWYEVGPTGSVVAKPEGPVASIAAGEHMQLVPLFNNLAGNDAFLHSPLTRTAAVHHIVDLVRSRHFAGVNIDFQLLKPGDRADLTAFMTELDHALPKGSLVSMSVIPSVSSNRNGPAAAYDLAALAKVSDAVVLMTYDLHGNGTPPGPVSPYPWVVKAVRYSIRAGLPPSKIYLGIADYGYEWRQGSTKAVTIPIKAMHQHIYGTYRWVPGVDEGTDTLVKHGVTHIIWFVPDRGAVARIELAKRLHLAGVAFWRLGYEDAKWWNAVSGALSRP